MKKLNHLQFLEKLELKNTYYAKKEFVVSGFYVDSRTKIEVETLFGKCLILPTSLLKGFNPTIETAIDKNNYIIAQFKNVHGDKYNYDYVHYKNMRNKVIIFCEKHNMKFSQLPSCHLSGRGCPCCGKNMISLNNQKNCTTWSYSDWESIGNISLYFDCFKVYIVKCWDENEEFYKIGKTFTNINKRLSKNNLPYKYEVLKIFTGTALEISKLEKKLIDINKEYKYIPKQKFKGMYECFNNINNIIWEI